MKKGHIYILSNDSLKDGLLKIGRTQMMPDVRAKHLSRSTSIPSNFKVECSYPVADSRTAKRRVHLLLDEHRFNTQKEFFIVDYQKAKDIVEKVAAYCKANYHFADIVGKRHDLITATHSKRLRLRQLGSVSV